MPRIRRKPLTIAQPYQVISNETAGTTGFAPDPIDVVLVATLEIAIADSHGEYLLVTSPRYEAVAASGPAESSQWSPPYVAQTLTKPRVGWKNVAQVLEAVAEAKTDGVDGWFPQTALQEVIATWACGLYRVKLVGELTEYKRSWSTPSDSKVYHVMRFAANPSTCVPRALADPESRKGFAFLPIDDERYATAVRERHCERHGRTELMFIGKPLVSNLAAVVESPETRAWLCEGAVEIPREEFSTEFAGLLVCGDIANYGSACRYAHDRMQGIHIDGEDADIVLRDLATSGMTRIFHDAGLSQVHIAGDGFIAAMPLDAGAECAQYLDQFLGAYARFTELLDSVNTRMAAHAGPGGQAPVLGSRLAVHYGPYRYGKMAQAASLVTGFDGAAIIDVARLEQGLRAATKAPDAVAELGALADGHSVIFSEAGLAAADGAASLPTALTNGFPTTAVSKEAVAAATVFQFDGVGSRR